MMDPRELAILHDAHDLQQARDRLFLRLDALSDMCDARAFLHVLADVAAVHARYKPLSAKDRALWGSLAMCLQFYLEGESL